MAAFANFCNQNHQVVFSLSITRKDFGKPLTRVQGLARKLYATIYIAKSRLIGR
jgi:hypothetical protein